MITEPLKEPSEGAIELRECVNHVLLYLHEANEAVDTLGVCRGHLVDY